MQLYENSIRMNCEYILDHIAQIKRLNTDRNIVFFLNEINDKIIETLYTSDEWFNTVNMSHDQSLQLLYKNTKLQGVIKGLENEFDDLDTYKKPK